MKKQKTKLSPENIRYLKILGIVFAAILFFAIINNLGSVFSVLSFVLDVAFPLIIGACIAFILNIPLKFFENRAFKKLTQKNGKTWRKMKRPLCLVLSILCILTVLVVLLSFIIPQFIYTCKHFIDMLPEYLDRATVTLKDLTENLNLPIDLDSLPTDFGRWLSSLDMQSILQNVFGIASGIVGTAIDFFLGLIFAIYLLASKEALGKVAKGVLFALISRRRARKILSILTLSNRAFTGFVTGQCVEVLVIGSLCFVGMLIFGMAEYALLVSCIVAITAFIPIFGPIIGSLAGAFIIFIVDPIKAIWFLVFIIVLQQLESHILYPKIMGHHVSLPGILVLVAVTIGGGLFGIPGIIISVPLSSVLYTLFSRWMTARLRAKNICRCSVTHDASEPKTINEKMTDCEFTDDTACGSCQNDKEEENNNDNE